MSKPAALALALGAALAASAARAYETLDLPRSLQISKDVRGRPAAQPKPASVAHPPVTTSSGREPGGR